MPAPTGCRLWVLALALLVAACQPTSSQNESPAAGRPDPAQLASPGGAAGGTLRYAISEPDGIIPAEATTPAEFAVVGALFDSLTSWGPELEVEPRAATGWWSNDDATEWTFVLRADATFHDGSPVTAGDVKAAWELAVTNDVTAHHLRDVRGYQALRGGDAHGLDGVRALSKRRLRVTLSRPNADFPAVVAHPALAPIPEAAWEKDPKAFRDEPIGNGPFAVSEPWVRGQFVRASRFEAWRNGDRPELGEVVFQITDLDTAFVAFQQGRIDFTELPPGALDTAIDRYGRSEDGYTGPGVLTGDVPVLYFLGFTMDRSPVDRAEVREAVSLAIDRESLVRSLREGNLRVARSIVPPAIPGAREFACRHCRHEPEAAEELFREHGVEELTLWFNEEGDHEDVASRVRQDLSRVGVDATFRSKKFGDYLDALEAGRAPLYRFGWSLDYPTMDNALRPLLHSSATPDADGGGYNFGGYADEEVDALLDEGRATLDPDERRSRYREAEELVLNRDYALVPLFTYRHNVVVSDRLSGFVYTPMATVDLSTVRVVDEADSDREDPVPRPDASAS